MVKYRPNFDVIGIWSDRASTSPASPADVAAAVAILEELTRRPSPLRENFPLQLGARLTLGQIQVEHGRRADGKKTLAALEHDAAARGWMLIARKAREARSPAK